MSFSEIVLSDLTHVETGVCQCPACGNTDDLSLDFDVGGTRYDNDIWTPEQIAAHLNRTNGGFANSNRDLTTDGRQNNEQDGTDDSVITFGFFNTQAQLANNGYVYQQNGRSFGLSEYFQFGAFTAAQRDATREAMTYWDDVVAVSFREASADVADMNFGNLTNSPNTQAYARIPTAGLDATLAGQVREIGGDVWVSVSQASNFQFDEGLYGLNTLTHEIGHAIGLSHPGNYNFGPGFAVTYKNGAEYAQDIRNYTIMSYWNPRAVGIQDHDYHLGTITYGGTPMVHDILAAQRIYGADMTTRTGDNTYGFNVSGDQMRDSFDFVKTPAPVTAIWDAGGIDTLDASGYRTNQVIDLTPGGMSSIGGVTLADAPSLAQVNANRAVAGYAPLSQAAYDTRMANLAANPDAGLLVDNVGIAYGTTIENAVGGSGNDVIIGNSASNRLNGNAGNDVMSGGDGVDFFTGGTGNDTFIADINGQTVSARRGNLSLDVITDFTSGQDKIDLSGIDANLSRAGDQAFVFQGFRANRDAGDLTIRVYDSINGAENALGMEIDGIDGVGAAGPVTVVFGNVDGGAPDFAIALLNTNGVSRSDFIDNVVGTIPLDTGSVSSVLGRGHGNGNGGQLLEQFNGNGHHVAEYLF